MSISPDVRLGALLHELVLHVEQEWKLDSKTEEPPSRVSARLLRSFLTDLLAGNDVQAALQDLVALYLQAKQPTPRRPTQDDRRAQAEALQARLSRQTGSPQAFRLYSALAHFAQQGDNAPSRSVLADCCGVSPDTIDRALKELADAGSVRIDSGAATRTPNRYHLIAAPAVAVRTRTWPDAGMLNPHEERWRRVICPTCAAPPTHACRATTSGVDQHKSHVARRRAYQHTLRNGDRV